ncbi:MAG: sulfurtransferase TusA family protein [Dehalococcoidia bacterium]|jgi:TusA-related sulfurtransferase
MSEVDARGLSCPLPVINTKKALEGSDKQITVIVDNATARDNVTRLAKSNKCTVAVEQKGNDYYLTLVKS